MIKWMVGYKVVQCITCNELIYFANSMKLSNRSNWIKLLWYVHGLNDVVYNVYDMKWCNWSMFMIWNYKKR